MKTRSRSKAGTRRFPRYLPRAGDMHASGGIAHAAANLYFRLAGGNAAQKQAATEWRDMFLELRNLTSP